MDEIEGNLVAISLLLAESGVGAKSSVLSEETESLPEEAADDIPDS